MHWVLKKIGVDSILHIATLFWLVTILEAADNKPELQRSQVYIYRKTSIIPVKIYHCLYNDTRNAYYDITENCLTAFKTGVFIDKWKDSNDLRKRGSGVIRMEEYTAKADLLTNEIFLRSGTICRYDRGFCYDTRETTNYAVVWRVESSILKKCPAKIEQVFYGFVDFWTFKINNLKYLFYYDQGSDRSFYLYLGNTTTNCYNKVVWSVGDEFLVSKWELTKTSRQNLLLQKKYFPLRPKKYVTDAILRDFDLRVYPFDFDKKIGKEHLSDYNNLKTILKRYEDLISKASIKLDQLSSNTSKSGNIDTLQRSIDGLKVKLTKMETEVRQGNQKCIESESDSRSTKNELMNFRKLYEQRDLVEYDIFNSTISKIYGKLHEEGEIFSGRVDSQAGDLIKFQQNLDDLDVVVRNQVTDFIMKKDMDNILFNLEGETIQNLESYKNHLTAVIEKKEHALMDIYKNGQRNISDKYKELTLKIDRYNDDINNRAKTLENQIESELLSLKQFLVREVDNSNQNILPTIGLMKNNLTNLQNELNRCKSMALDSIQMQKNDLSSLQDNMSTMHLLSIKNDLQVTHLTKKLNETIEDMNEKTEDILKNNDQYVSQKKLLSILSASETDYRKKMDELAKNLKLVDKDQENKMRKYIDTEIQTELASLSRNIQSTCENSVQDIEKNVYSDLIDLRKQVIINISAIKNNLGIVAVDLSNLEQNLEGEIEAIAKTTKDLKIDVNNCKGDLINISRTENETFTAVKENITQLFKNDNDNNENLMELKLKLTELEINCDRIEQLSLNSSAEFSEEFNRVKDEIGDELSAKLNELHTSSFGNWSMLKSDITAIKENIEYNDELIQAKIEHTTTDMEEMKQVIENNKELVLNTSMKNEEVLKNLLSNVTEIQNEITMNGGSIFQIDIDLTKVRSNISDLFRNISNIANDQILTGESLNQISGYIVKINDTLRTQIDESGIIEHDIENIMDKIHSMNDNITNNGNIIRHLKETFTKNINSTQLFFDNVREDLNRYKIGISDTLVQNEESLDEIRQTITDNKAILAKGDLDMINVKSQMQIIQKNLESNEKAVEDVKTSTLAYLNARLVSFTQEIAQIHNMILNDKSIIQKVENEMSQFSKKNDNCCETMEQKLIDYENTIDELKKKLSTVEKELGKQNTDLGGRLKKIELDLYYEQPVQPIAA